MSDKRLRPPASANVGRRVLGGVIVGVLIGSAAVLVVRTVRDDGATAAKTTTPAPTVTVAAPLPLAGTFDTTLVVTSAEYGATWPATSPRLSPGQKVTQRWAIECRGASCAVD